MLGWNGGCNRFNQLDWCPKIQKLGTGMGLKRRGGRARETEKKVGGRERALGDTLWAVEWEGQRQRKQGDWETGEGEACAEGA